MDATISPWMFWWFLHKSNELPTLSYTHTHTHTHTPTAPFCVKGYLTFSWASSFTRAWPSHRQVFKIFIANIWGRGILADKSFKWSFASQWKNREVGVDRKKKHNTNIVRKKRNHSPRWKGEEKGDCFCRLWLIYEFQCLKWELGTGRSCASSHSTCFEQGFNFICKCLLSRQGVPAQMKAPQSVSSNSLGLITSLQSLRELEI